VGVHITCSLSSLISWFAAAFVFDFCVMVLVVVVVATRDAPPTRKAQQTVQLTNSNWQVK
jgi:hypothetical protein